MIISEQRLDIDLSKYDSIDSSLIVTKDLQRTFGVPEDYVEAHVYTINDVLIYSDYNYTGYKVPGSLQGKADTTTDQLEFSPGEYLQNLGYSLGTYRVDFNILRKKVFNTNQKVFFIKEISADRTEIRVYSNTISNNDVETGVLNFINEIQTSPYYKDFLLNFGDNSLVNAVNILLDKNTNPYSFLIKLYKPLPVEFDLKSSFWITEELSAPVVYEVELFPQIQENPTPFIKGPNFDIDVDVNSIVPSDYENINTILSNTSLNAYQKLISKINESSIQISVDYTDYSSFVHFSSAKERLLNFVYKVQLIEQYDNDIDTIKNVPNYTSSVSTNGNIYTLQNNINNIIKNFDGYEYHLYYTSGSTAWPKSNGLPPYTLYPSTSSQVTNWLGSDDYNSPFYGGQLNDASIYDEENQNRLASSIPEFITMDTNNDQYSLFMDMIGQHFDNVWIYMRSITDLYKNKNELNKGISKDMVYYALRSLGIKLYNSKSNDNLFDYLIGASVSGSYTPTGSAGQTYISASVISVPGQDLQKELLKRIYHNTSYLLKSKGTARGIKALISTFGIPSSILDVTENGGFDKSRSTVEYTYDRSSYALNNSGSSVLTSWGQLYSQAPGQYVPDTIEFRFKPEVANYNTTSSLLETYYNGVKTFGIELSPDNTKGYPYASASFYISGSPFYETASLSLPIFYTGSDGDTGWWNVYLGRREHYEFSGSADAQYYDFIIKNKIGTRIGHQASASLYVSGSYNVSWGLNSQSLYLAGSGSKAFNGKLQELRYWSEPLSESTFDYHVLNPESIEGNTSGSAYTNLVARFALGNDLNIYNHTVNTQVRSVAPNYSNPIFNGIGYNQSASFVGFSNENNYVPISEEYVTDVPNSVYSSPINHKIRIVNNSITGSVLSPFLRLEEKDTDYRTKDTHFIDVSFSPQNEVNKDIIAQYGGTIDIDQYIGDPNNDQSTSYPELVALNDQYYEKYDSRYIVKDFIRLISFYDNSLFKMIEDYVPARTEVTTGLTIKSPILERPKAKRVKGIMEENHQSYDSTIMSGEITGDSNYTSGYKDGRDFYQGELSGSMIDIDQDFKDKNTNPYALYVNNLNISKFSKSNYNPLINYVSASLVSTLFKKYNPLKPLVLENIEIQDSNYSNPVYTRPRYDGIKTTSAKYNSYTEGDMSYGKNSNIDINTYKFGFSNDVNTINLNFSDKTTINLKYLIDQSGSIVELSSRNDNIFEIQTMYKKGDFVNVSLFDKYNPTNQSNLDGRKRIFEGGYAYSPIMFRKNNEILNFRYIVPDQTVSTKYGVKSTSTSTYIYRTIGYQEIANFTTPSQGPGGTNTFSINGTVMTGDKFSLRSDSNSNWSYNSIVINKINTFKKSDGTTFSADNSSDGYGASYYTLDWFTPNKSGSANGGYTSLGMDGSAKVYEDSNQKYYYFTAPVYSTYDVNVNVPLKISFENSQFGAGNPAIFKIIGVIEKQNVGDTTWTYLDNTILQPIDIPSGTYNIGVDQENSAIYQIGNISGPTSYYRVNCSLANKSYVLNQGDSIRLKVYFIEVRNFFGQVGNIYFEIMKNTDASSFFEVYDNIKSDVQYVYTTTLSSAPPFIYSSNNNDPTRLAFNNASSLIYGNAYFIAPPSNDPASISNYYSPVSFPFKFEIGDIIRLEPYDTYNITYFTVMGINEPIIIDNGTSKTVATPLSLILDKPIPKSFTNQAPAFAFFRRYPDETSIILDFNKTPGQSSNALIIPDNLYSPIKKDIANIIAPIKDTILSKVLIVA
jgi:hypothetical protein